MRRAWIQLAFFCVGLMAISSPAWGDPILDKLASKPLPAFPIPQISPVVLDNGIKIFFLPEDNFPIFQIQALIRTGTIYDPADQVGLASFTAQVMRTGGFGAMTGDQIDERLEFLPAEIGSNVEAEMATANAACLVKDVDEVLGLFFDMLRQPNFDGEKFNLAKKAAADSISRRNEDPDSIGGREFSQLFYGEKSVWARIFTRQDLAHITREDLIDFHRRYYTPDRMLLAVSGKVSQEWVVTQVKKLSEGWQRSTTALPQVSPVVKEWTAGLYLIDKDVNQAAIFLGHFADRRDNPDRFALILANYILGGTTFSSRIGSYMRSEGLAYAAGSAFGFGLDYGLFQATTQTRSEMVVRAIQDITKIVREVVSGERPFTAAELQEAKRTFLNNMVFDYVEPFDIVAAETRFQYLGYPPGYSKLFFERISEVTLPELEGVAKKYFFPEKMKTLVVGDQKTVLEPMQALGQVSVLPLDEE